MLYNIWKMEPNNLQLKSEYKNHVKILDKVIKEAKIIYEKKNKQTQIPAIPGNYGHS